MTYSVTTATTGDNTNKGVLKLLLGTFVDGQHHCPNEIFLDTYTTGTKTVYWKQRAVAGGALSLSKIKLYNDTRWNGVIDNIVIKKATNTSYVSGGSYGTTPSGGRKTFNTEVISIDNKIGAITGDAVTSWTSLREQQDGYNKAMFNNLRKIEISGFRNKPKDVIGLDLISKKSNETSVYVVKKYKKSDLDDLYKGGKITITKEEIKSLLPSNQLLRSYDNVPRKAKAQEVTANRLLYGNYVQQYNISDTPVNIDVKLQKNDIQNNIATKSIKSIRDYEVGVSYLDRFGRQTPVFSDESGVVKVGQEFSSCANSFSVKVNSKAPDWATHYKYWVKDASSEFYNIAMDRFYNAEEEENVWISFPSSDTSKVSIGDYIVIKKAHAKDSVAIQDNTSTVKYKVLDKESNAPDYIKYKKEEVGVSNSATTL